MPEITLRNGDQFDYEITVPLIEFFWRVSKYLVRGAYIDGYEIESDDNDPDNTGTRWFHIHRTTIEDKTFTINGRELEYPAESPVQVQLFGVQYWQDNIDATNELLAKYSVSISDTSHSQTT